MKYLLDPLYQFADFKGRATRKEYWMFMLLFFIASILLAIIDNLLGTPFLGFMDLFYIVFFIPSISILVRRLHDRGESGWLLLAMIPMVGHILIFIFSVQDSVGDNKWGKNPKMK